MGGTASSRINAAARQAYEGKGKTAKAAGAAKLKAYRKTYGAGAVPTAKEWARGVRARG